MPGEKTLGYYTSGLSIPLPQTSGLCTETSGQSWLKNSKFLSSPCSSCIHCLSHSPFTTHTTYISQLNTFTPSVWPFNTISICLPGTKQYFHCFVLTIVRRIGFAPNHPDSLMKLSNNHKIINLPRLLTGITKMIPSQEPCFLS